MPQTYIYSPFTAQARGLNTYCIDGTPHYSGFSGFGMCCPVDIGGTGYVSAGTSVPFYCSASIGSIRTIRRNNFCDGNFGSWEDAVFVELYRFANADCHIGTLFYGHLTSRIANGVYNAPNGRVLGYLPAAHPTCCCYTYPHIHVGRDTNGITRSLSCYQLLTKQTSWFYSWFYNDGMC